MGWSKTALGVGAATGLAGLAAVDCGGATASQTCVPGATQVCVGPGACMGGQACRSDGTGGILNVPEGAFSVRATLAATGQPIAVANTFVNAGVASLVTIRVRTH